MGEFDDPLGHKGNSIPRFAVEPVKLEFASAQQGRPIFEDREFVTIIIPGDRRAQVHEPVNEGHKARWPKEYEAFRAGRDAPLEGTPLTEWPSSKMTRSRVEELAHFHIHTVEQLAGVNDNQLQGLGMGARSERDSARLFLEVAKTGTGPLEKLLQRVEDLTRENERKDRDLAISNQRIAELTAQLGSIHGGSNAPRAA